MTRGLVSRTKLELRMISLLQDIQDNINMSEGIYGMHYNGDNTNWGQFEFPQEIADILEETKCAK